MNFSRLIVNNAQRHSTYLVTVAAPSFAEYIYHAVSGVVLEKFRAEMCCSAVKFVPVREARLLRSSTQGFSNSDSASKHIIDIVPSVRIQLTLAQRGV